jgi:hypothetical protein
MRIAEILGDGGQACSAAPRWTIKRNSREHMRDPSLADNDVRDQGRMRGDDVETRLIAWLAGPRKPTISVATRLIPAGCVTPSSRGSQ